MKQQSPKMIKVSIGIIFAGVSSSNPRPTSNRAILPHTSTFQKPRLNLAFRPYYHQWKIVYCGNIGLDKGDCGEGEGGGGRQSDCSLYAYN